MQTVNNSESPFVSISSGFRIFFILYFLIVILLQKVLIILLQNDISLVIHLLDIVYFGLVFLPIFFYRKEYGWLHPLIFPALFSLSKSIVADPLTLFNLFFIDQSNASFQISHVLLSNMSDSEIRYIHIKGQLFNILAIISYYFGFFFFRDVKFKRLYYSQPLSNHKIKLFVIYLFSLIIFLIYIQLKGGVNAHILSWSSGRFNALAGDGPILVIAKLAGIATLIWFAMGIQSAIKSPLFWFMALTSIPTQFLLTGSRSEIVYISIWFVMIFMIQSKRIPGVQIASLGLVTALLISTLGLIRNSTYQGEIAWDQTVSDFSFEDAISRTHEELEKRKGEESGYLPVMAKVPDEVDYLYGKSYIGALFFFVPRYFWRDKPRGAGALVGELIFGRKSGAGVPPSAVGEVYWNFGIIGVTLVFALFGRIHKALERAFLINHRFKAFQVIYIITLFMFTPSTIKLVSYLQIIIPTLFILWWIGSLSFFDNAKIKHET